MCCSALELKHLHEINFPCISGQARTIMEEWYNELFSKTNGTDFDTDEVPDLFKVKIHDGDTVFTEWDITQELLEHGMKWLNYTNSSLNVSLQMTILHKDIVERFRGEESLEKILELAQNDAWKFDHLLHWEHVSHGSEGKWNFLPYLYYSQGAATFVLGVVGFVVKYRAEPQAKVVKVTRMSYSIWCLFAGLLLIISEFTRNIVFTQSNHFDKLKWFMTLTYGSTKILLVALIICLKMFTVVVYGFQNVMVYRPFFFREHKKALNKWFLRVSFCQSASIFVGVAVWAAILVFAFDHLSCIDVYTNTDNFKLVIIILTFFGYIVSLFLSAAFLVGYYRKSTKDLGRSDVNSIKKTMIACAVEIIFDLILPTAVKITFLACFSISLHNFRTHGVATGFDTKCSMTGRLEALDGALSKCSIVFLALQPTVQELVFLISVLIDYCRGNSS